MYWKPLVTMKNKQGAGAHVSGCPVVFGEVLFDQFADGSAVLGGAPFNVAWHLQGFGLQPLLISRIGSDPLGERVREAMRDWGMNPDGLQTDPEHPTGRVQVRLAEGQPSYSILANQAYDYIESVPARTAIEREHGRLLYHGTLAARAECSRQTLLALREQGLPLFVDLNLREPWWEQARTAQLLQGVRWLKLNDEELATLVPPAGTDPFRPMEQVREQYGIELLTCTLGAAGAQVLGHETRLQARAKPVDVVDTVGAGDAFSAVLLLGLWHDWPLAVSLQRAVDFAAEICRQRGATRADSNFYKNQLGKWEDEQS